MKYCSVCGSLTEKRIPEGDNRERDCCTGCGFIHYTNPNIIVGTIPVKENSVLLCKRAIEPRYGKWTLPGGFLENGETVSQGAFREPLKRLIQRSRWESCTQYLMFLKSIRYTCFIYLR